MDSSWIVVAFGVAGIGCLLASVFAGRSGRLNAQDRRLATIERRLDLIMKRLEIDDPEPELPDVVAHLERGEKIGAIKAYRERTGAGLKEAKDAVEALARERGL
jgi:hypothetical protein